MKAIKTVATMLLFSALFLGVAAYVHAMNGTARSDDGLRLVGDGR